MNELSNLDLKKECFPVYVKINNDALLEYYLLKKLEADKLVLEDEFVGMTYDNLDLIEKILRKNIK